MRLSEHIYKTFTHIKTHLVFVEKVQEVMLGEIVRVVMPDGRQVEGEVLSIDDGTVLVQTFDECTGLDIHHSAMIFTDRLKQAPLSPFMLNRIFNGSFQPLDDHPLYVPDKWWPATGYPINPASRERPRQFIETGISAIDGLNTLVQGQKLPIFSCAGLPAKEIVGDILQYARCPGSAGSEKGKFVMVFVALGLTHHEYAFYMETLSRMQTEFVAFINLASDAVVERLLAPRFGLTAAEYLAFELGYDVLAVIADMTNYCDALREVSTSKEELPGRRGYPGYMYSDLASLYERAGRIHGRSGSVTMLPVLTMPEDDMTHPIPDLTGYITEGQIVLSRALQSRSIYPPIDVLPSLSRLMQHGIGEQMTRKDHRSLASMFYKHYAKGRDVRVLEAIVGREGLIGKDAKALDFADDFEKEFIHQPGTSRSISHTLDVGKDLLIRHGLETFEDEKPETEKSL